VVGAFSQQPLVVKLLIGSKKVTAGRCNNGMDLLYHHAKHGGDPELGASCRLKSVDFFVYLLPAGLPTGQGSMPVHRAACLSVLHLLRGPKIGFSPSGRHYALTKVKFSTRECRSAPRAKFHLNWGRNVGIQPLKLSKFDRIKTLGVQYRHGPLPSPCQVRSGSWAVRRL